MERRKIIIYSIFVAVAAYGFYFHFLSGETGRSTRQVKSEISNIPLAVNSVKSSDFSGETAVGNVNRSSKEYAWGRNPFKNKDNSSGKIVKSAAVFEKSTRPHVTAISAEGSDQYAVADGKVLKIGDYTGAWKIVKIEKRRVLFENSDEQVWIKLGGQK